MARLTFIETLPSSLEAAVTEFKDGYLVEQSKDPAPAWYSEFGDVGISSEPKTSIPITSIAAVYTREMGDVAFAKFANGFVEVVQEKFHCGYEFDAYALHNDKITYSKFQLLPSQLIIAEENHIARNVASIIENGESLPIKWAGDGITFFSDNHPVNIGRPSLGVFSNIEKTPTAITIDSILNQQSKMLCSVMDPTGRNYTTTGDTLIVPSSQYVAAIALTKQLTVASPGAGSEWRTQHNPLFGMKVIHVPDLTNELDWYLVNSVLAKIMPCWSALKWTPKGINPIEDNYVKFKNILQIGGEIWYGFAPGFPHPIRKIKGKVS